MCGCKFPSRRGENSVRHSIFLDLIVENKVIIEIKSVESLKPIHSVQLLTYLKLTNCKLGLLLNFNVLHLKEGIKRVANNL
ncbi:GxxExxY protein [Anabaena subtropica]|uniref:GxxExxY protein n=1 Tax=Anabaena subtropica TaxID=425380 RepID=UPI00241107C6|nr:GxxExxY protein [Anabaena subtropica]